EPALRQKSAAAAAQLAADADGYESRALGFERSRKTPLQVQARRRAAMLHGLLHHFTREVEQDLARALVQLRGMGIFNREGSVADSAVAGPTRVSGIPHIERGRPHIAAQRLIDQPPDGMVAAGTLTLADPGLKALDPGRRFLIFRLAGFIIMIM